MACKQATDAARSISRVALVRCEAAFFLGQSFARLGLQRATFQRMGRLWSFCICSKLCVSNRLPRVGRRGSQFRAAKRRKGRYSQNGDTLKFSLLPWPGGRANASPDPLTAFNHAQAKDGSGGPDGDFGNDGRTGDGANPERLRRICKINSDHAEPCERDEGPEGDQSELLPVHSGVSVVFDAGWFSRGRWC